MAIRVGGGNYARNLGIKAATGDYVAFLDDDDFWFPEKISKQVELLEKQSDCGMVHCGRLSLFIGSDGKVKRALPEYPSIEYKGDVKKKILYAICCTTSTLLVKRELLIDIGMFDENLGFWQDYELAIRLGQRTPFYFVDELLVGYNINSSDKQRLTNKYYDWHKAVNYIHDKHKKLYAPLNWKERQAVKLLELNDGKMRAKTNGLWLEYCKLIMQSLIPRIAVNTDNNLRK